jgi:hypothetical protein
MKTNSKAKSSWRVFCNKKTVAFASFLCILALIFSPLMSVANGSSVVPDIIVGNETELLKAISSAPNKKVYVIGISEDIFLENSLEVPKNKHITLVIVSNMSSFVALIGSDGVDTIVVKSGGELVLREGIVVTHAVGNTGRGIYVERKGTFILSGGEVSGNTINTQGVDVYNYGAGVYNQGTFKMYSGKILNNTASGGDYGLDYGGGVYNSGNFIMSDGVISDNTAGLGGGVSNDGTFNMVGGVISGNSAKNGGGVYNEEDGNFVMSGGEITRNTALSAGGILYFSGSVKGTVTLSGGKIFNNTAINDSKGFTNDIGRGFVDKWTSFLPGFLLIFGIPAVVIVVSSVLLVKHLKKRKQSVVNV